MAWQMNQPCCAMACHLPLGETEFLCNFSLLELSTEISGTEALNHLIGDLNVSTVLYSRHDLFFLT